MRSPVKTLLLPQPKVFFFGLKIITPVLMDCQVGYICFLPTFELLLILFLFLCFMKPVLVRSLPTYLFYFNNNNNNNNKERAAHSIYTTAVYILWRIVLTACAVLSGSEVWAEIGNNFISVCFCS